MKYLFAFCFSVVFGHGVAALADDSRYLKHRSVAQAYCPLEWKNLVAWEPNTWEQIPPIEVDPNLDPAFQNLSNKYVTSVVALAGHMGSYLGLESDEPLTKKMFGIARAKFELAMCLELSDAERDAFVSFTSESINHSKDQVREALFGKIDQFYCMRMDEAARQLFELDTQSPSFLQDSRNIHKTVVRACE